MCGINGIINFLGEAELKTAGNAMNNSLAHRGPDDAGIFVDQGVFLGHRRLSIIDLSAAGHQPMNFLDGRYTIVYNGELYNFKELKNELSEYSFNTHSDTEVILAAYSKWGSNCLSRFNGMFALAIWDKVEQKLFIARDRLGIKPLYYFIQEDRIIFSSEIRSILASGFVKRKLDQNSIGDYLRFQTVHAPNTIIENVKMLMPGHFMTVQNGKVDFFSWWNPEINESVPPTTYAEKCGTVRQLLRDAVERRLIADVPFGAFLSGGIDSSAIVGLMSEVAASPVNTFNITFDDTEFSEAVFARQVAKKFNTVHHEIKLSPADFLKDVPAALDAMDHPSGDGPNTYVVSKVTKQAGISVALSGLGGDELFAGYDIFKRSVELEKKKWLNSVPLGIRKFAGERMKAKNPGVAGEKMAAILGMEKINFPSFYPFSREVLNASQLSLVTQGKIVDPENVLSCVLAIEKKFPSKDFLLSKVSIAEISTYMQNVLLRDSDQMSMAHALEVRVPFLDYTLVEYVLNIPDDQKFPFTQKKLLVDALGDLLPMEIVNRPKMGFSFPWKNWMKNELRGFCEERLLGLSKMEPFEKSGIDQLWNSFLKDDPKVTWSRIWPMVVLAHWIEKNKINE